MPYDPDLFRGAAPYYRYRAPYAAEAIAFAAEKLGLTPASRLIDLGCGPGTLALQFAPLVAEVVAMDPDEGMLAEGQRQAAEAGVGNIRWMQAGSEDLAQLAGPFRGALMGQSFHWMMRDQVLRDLHALIEHGGGIALINPGERRPQESWQATAADVVARYLGASPPRPPQDGELRNEPSLHRSAFEVADDVEFASTFVRDIPSIIGMIFSTSSSTPRRFGDRRAEFEAELEVALRALRPDGVFHEAIETGVAIALKR